MISTTVLNALLPVVLTLLLGYLAGCTMTRIRRWQPSSIVSS